MELTFETDKNKIGKTEIEREEFLMQKGLMKKSVLALAAVLSISLTACGSAADDGGTAENEQSSGIQDAMDAFAAAQEKKDDITSLESQTIVELAMDVSAGEETQTMQSVTTMDMSCFYDPMRLKADVTVDAGESGTTDMKIYAERNEDKTYTLYMYDGSSWQSQTVEKDALKQYDASSTITGYLDDAYHFEDAGTEQQNGSDAYKYTGQLTGSQMKDAVLSSGALNSFSALGIESSQLDSIMDELGDIPISLWIDKESLYPVRYELDMTSVMDTLIAKIIENMRTDADMEGFSMSISNMKMSMTCSNYNEAAEFTIPDEAKEAQAAK